MSVNPKGPFHVHSVLETIKLIHEKKWKRNPIRCNDINPLATKTFFIKLTKIFGKVIMSLKKFTFSNIKTVIVSQVLSQKY